MSLDYLHQVKRGIDYIEDRLDAEIDLAEVARHAGISHWHFQRIFKALTNETLKTYVRSRRFASAQHKLAHTNERILEIAFSSGFDSQETFTRAFKKAFGVTPARYRKTKESSRFPRKVRFDEEYLTHLHRGVSLHPELYVQPEMTLVGMNTRFFSVDSEKNNIAVRLPNLWGAFLPRLAEIPRTVPGVCYGIVRQTPEKTDELDYLAAIEVDDVSWLPEGMVDFHLPSARYAKFAHRGHPQRVDQTVNYIYSSWLARSGMRHTYGADVEFYGAGYQQESEDSVLHYAIPVADSDQP